jgi:hypothetical protein
MVRSLLDYNKDTGKLYWKARGYPAFDNRWAGKEAFVTLNEKKYKVGRLFDRERYKAHRVVWAWWYGVWPDGEVDHINRIRSDNRIENLRVVSPSENRRNVSPSIVGESGCVGVSRSGNKWRSRVSDYSGKVITLGYYHIKEDAILARKSAESEYGYHPNHGVELK